MDSEQSVPMRSPFQDDDDAARKARTLVEAQNAIPQLKDAQDVAKWMARYRFAGHRQLNHALMKYYGVL